MERNNITIPLTRYMFLLVVGITYISTMLYLMLCSLDNDFYVSISFNTYHEGWLELFLTAVSLLALLYYFANIKLERITKK